MMRKLGIGVVAVLALVQAVSADEGTWMTDFAKAQQLAKEQKKLVCMDFTGSDWCPSCKLLHKNVLTSKEFVTFAKANLILVLVDFPDSKPQSEAQKKANNALAEKFKVEGFPTLVVLNSDGKQVDVVTGYRGESAKEIVSRLEKLRAQNGAAAQQAG